MPPPAPTTGTSSAAFNSAAAPPRPTPACSRDEVVAEAHPTEQGPHLGAVLICGAVRERADRLRLRLALADDGSPVAGLQVSVLAAQLVRLGAHVVGEVVAL